MEPPRSSTPPRRPARTAVLADTASPLAGPGNAVAAGATSAAVSVMSPRGTKSKWGEVVTSLPTVLASQESTISNSAAASPRPFDARISAAAVTPPPARAASEIISREHDRRGPVASPAGGDAALTPASQLPRRPVPESGARQRSFSSSFWENQQVAQARVRDSRESQGGLDPETLPVEQESAETPRPMVGAQMPLLPHAAQGTPVQGPLELRDAADRRDSVRRELEMPLRSTGHPQPRGLPSSADAGAEFGKVFSERRSNQTRSASLPGSARNSALQQHDIPSSYSRFQKYSLVDGNEVESEFGGLATTHCLSELVDLLQHRLYEQGQQISQLRAELGSRTRVAAAFAEARGRRR